MDNVLKNILSLPSPSGYEKKFQQYFASVAKPLADKVEVDLSGNVIAVVNPNATKKVLIAAHGDEIGFMITKADDNGFLSATPVGGLSPKVVFGMKIRILADNNDGEDRQDVIGVFGANAEHLGGIDKMDWENVFIDIGAKTKAEAETLVKMGSYAVYIREPEMLQNNRVSGRGLDDRACVYMLYKLLEKIKNSPTKPDIGVYCVSTTCEETGVRGAYYATKSVNPDMAIACDVTFAIDHPTAKIKEKPKCELGKGPGIAFGSHINPKLAKLIEKTAKANNIPYQTNIDAGRTGTDADRIQYMNDGIPCALVSLPLRYMHSPVETMDLADVDKQVDLLYHSLFEFAKLDMKKDLLPFEI